MLSKFDSLELPDFLAASVGLLPKPLFAFLKGFLTNLRLTLGGTIVDQWFGFFMNKIQTDRTGQ